MVTHTIWKNSLYSLISHQPDIHISIYVKKILFLINNCDITCSQHFNDFRAFPEYSNYMNDICENIQKSHLNKKRKTLIVFGSMISNKNLM